jgi:hypothetical protein
MNRVWIEIEALDDGENQKRADQVNAMISRLHANDEDRKLMMIFEWSDHHGRYLLHMGPSGSFKVLEDNGEWFNLDYFAGVED